MAGDSRNPNPLPPKAAEKVKPSVEPEVPDVIPTDSSSESEVVKLRNRWELASVLNFMSVFEPVLGRDLKLTAEEVEMGLIEPNKSVAQLHIMLLKGIPPVNKTLNASDGWVTALCKKLASWWPWVAEGENPLIASKGGEISRYNELDPTNRLLILKALCELRAEQDDTTSYINDALKQGKEISSFRKEKMGGNGSDTSYWYDGNTVMGYRLYREVRKNDQKKKVKGIACLTKPSFSSQWETLATNLEEFHKVVDELLSSKTGGEVTVGKKIEADIIPIIEKLEKKKERALKRKSMQDRLLNDLRSSNIVGITRSCRIRRPISYTFDDYDRAINEAIQVSNESRIDDNQSKRKKIEQKTVTPDGLSDTNTASNDSSGTKDEHMNGESENNVNLEDSEEDDDQDYDSEEEDREHVSESGSSGNENNNPVNRKEVLAQKPRGSRWSKRLAGVDESPPEEAKSPVAKRRLRQRPVVNSAANLVALDSAEDSAEDEKHTSSGTRAANLSSDTDSEATSTS